VSEVGLRQHEHAPTRRRARESNITQEAPMIQESQYCQSRVQGRAKNRAEAYAIRSSNSGTSNRLG